jgi:hypothetical protein
MKRLLVAAAVAAVAVVLPASTVWAGEYNPGRGYIFSAPSEAAAEHSQVLIYPNDDSAVGPAASICSFSGRDDTDTDDNALWASTPAGGRVQSVGQANIAFGEPPLKGAGCGPNAGAGD